MYSNFKQRLLSGLAALFRALFDRTVDVQADRELYLLEDRLRHQRLRRWEDQRFAARPAVATERLTAMPDGRAVTYLATHL